MGTIIRRVCAVIAVVFFLDVFISVWILRRDLKVRFPNLDYSLTKFGIASWYSEKDDHINLLTANGEKFNDEAMTCASWDYPFHQKLLVINPMNGRWVVCRVNDRGPNKRLNRKIDLTYSAFKKIANPKRGLTYVAVVPTSTRR